MSAASNSKGGVALSPPPEPPRISHGSAGVPVICLVAFTYTLDTLRLVLSKLPKQADGDAVFLVVTGLAPDFPPLTPAALGPHTTMNICDASDGIQLAPRTIYLLTPSQYLIQKQGRLWVHEQTNFHRRSTRLPIDTCLQSLGTAVGALACAIILSDGSDNDCGCAGLRDLKAAGGQIYAQTSSSDRLPSLEPRALHTDLADYTEAPAELAERIAAHLRHSAHRPSTTIEQLQTNNSELQRTNAALHVANKQLLAVNAAYEKQNRNLRARAQALDNLLSNLDVATLYLDEHLRIRRFTPACARIIPVEPCDLGQPISELGERLEVDLGANAEQVLKHQQTTETEIRAPGGAWLLMRVAPHFNAACPSAHMGVLVTFIDITRIKNTEEVTRAVGQELSHTTAQLSTQSSRLQDLFSVMAHDLKRPALGARGMLTLARRNLQQDKPQALRAQLEAADGALRKLASMLEDLDEVARVSSLQPVLEVTHLQNWLTALLAPYHKRAARAGVALQHTCPPSSHRFCRAAAEIAVRCLLDNAFVHGTDHPSPRINLTLAIAHQALHLAITDNGQGIAPPDHQRIFQPFRRLYPDVTPGSGVGLMLAKSAMEVARGEIFLHSDLNKGARFTLVLPCQPAAVRPANSPAPQRQRPILLIEDDTLDIKAVRKALGPRPLETAQNLAQAQQLLHLKNYALILLDLSLPDGHGLSLLPTLQNGLNRETPVLVLTGHAEGLPSEAYQLKAIRQVLNKSQLTGTLDQVVRELTQH